MLKIHSVESFGTHDGPGIRLVIFTQGCNFKCLYCHNPDTQDLIGGREMSTEEIVAMAEDSRPYFKDNGGVTVSGGEPLLQAEEVLKLFKQLKENNIHTALDTNGSIMNDVVKELLDYTDLLILDVKHINDDRHKELTGCSNKTVLEFASYREKQKKLMWIRYVLVPGYTDQPKYLKEFGEYFKDYKYIERAGILPYHTFGISIYNSLGLDYKLKDVPAPTPEQLAVARSIFEKYFKTVIVR